MPLRLRLMGALTLALALVGCSSLPGKSSSAPASLAPGTVIHVDLRVPIASSENVGGPCDASTFGSHTTSGTPLRTIPGATFKLMLLRGTQLAEVAVPTTGTIVPRGGDDPVFRTDCSFTFDVPSDPAADAFAFSVDDVYLPVPVVSRDQLAGMDWTATIGINVDQ